MKLIALPESKFQRDVWWNVLTFGVMGISGIVLNLLIVGFYGTEILGAFNQVYAVYIFFSQLAVFGLYASVLRYISEHAADRGRCSEILVSALLLCLGIGSLVTLLYYFMSHPLGELLHSQFVAQGLIFSLPGLWFFSLNKILLAFLNGLRQMKAYALFTAFRYLMLPLSLLALVIFKLPGYFSPAVFSITEFFLFILLVVFSFRLFSFVSLKRCFSWFSVHLLFGRKSLVGGAVTEMNSRVDVFMLGIFFSDKVVGVYSLAAIFAEGLAQIPTIFRVNFNPLLTRFVVEKKTEELRELIKLFFKKAAKPSLVLAVAAVVGFPLLAKLINNDPEVYKSWLVFIVLVGGIGLWSRYAVFWELPTQAGFPGRQTALIAAVALSNVGLNLILIPLWGIYGAALATSLSFISGIFYLKLIVRKILGIAI
jgi:O-antigen/teichoic acid export membrane protein